MEKYMTEVPFEIPADAIGLPTGGATVREVRLFHRGESQDSPLAKMYGRPFPADCRVYTGSIHPVDLQAPDILFEACFPVKWNGRLIQRGGAGVDGFISPSSMYFHGELRDDTDSVLGQGYAIFNCDGGYEYINGNMFDISWMSNRECFENYAYHSLKKGKDTVMYLAKKIYGSYPEKVYFYGGSNGGRECMKALQKYPDDYDGAICFFPVLYWTQKILMDARNSRDWKKIGRPGWLHEGDAEKLSEIVMRCNDAADANVIQDWKGAAEHKQLVREKFAEILNQDQIQALDIFDREMELPFELPYGKHVMPGYPVYEGTDIREQTEMFRQMNEMNLPDVSQSIMALLYAQDIHAEIEEVNLSKYEKRIRETAEWMDAWDTDLDRFTARHGKMILVQGTVDPQVTAKGTVQYYEALKKRYGQEKLDSFLKFYVIPGYGHGTSGKYLASADFIRALEQWDSSGKEPKHLHAVDISKDTPGRGMQLSCYPQQSELLRQS